MNNRVEFYAKYGAQLIIIRKILHIHYIDTITFIRFNHL